MGRAVAAVAALAVLAAGCSGSGAPAIAPKPAKRGPVALPPRDALALAARSGRNAITISVRDREATVGVIGGDGLGVDRLTVAVNGGPARPCGYGCYMTHLAGSPSAAVVRVSSGNVVFPLSTVPGPAAGLVARAGRALRSSRSVVSREWLSSGLGNTITTLWQEQAPDRLSYAISGGAAGIVIGGRRWDRAVGGSWVASPQTPLSLPARPWREPVTNAHILEADAGGWTVAFLDRSVPAWFRLRIDRRTGLPADSRMIATAHFMRDVYLAYGRRLRISPPR